MNALPRVAAALATPFGEDGNVRHDLLTAHCRALLDEGVEALALFGSTGEALSLSVAERTRALSRLVEEGIDPRRLIVGISANALPDAVALTREALAQGVRIVLAHPPVFFKDLSRTGIVYWYAHLIVSAAHDDLKLILYHWPRLTGVAIDGEIIAALRDRYPSIVAGYKDSSGDFAHAVELSERFPDVAVYLGGASRLASFIDAGGHGVICASANVIAAELMKLMNLKAAEREVQQARITRLEAVLDACGFVQGPKTVLARRYDEPNWRRVRPPLEPLPQDRAERLLDAWEKERTAGY